MSQSPSTPGKRPWSRWFHRLTAAHFILTSVTGVALYFRPSGRRPAWYSEETKEWLVMVHNGEWVSHLLVDQPFFSGILIGSVLAGALVRFSTRGLRGPL